VLHLAQPRREVPSSFSVSSARPAAPIAIRSSDTGQMTICTPASRSWSTENSSLLPNSVMLASIGTSTADATASNSARSRIASGKIASAPASTSAFARSMAA
jgi:hypothetical protein